MGAGRSKFAAKGSLAGAYAPKLEGVVDLPPKLDPTTRTYSATVPAGKKGGDLIKLDMKGHKISVTIPTHKEAEDDKGKRRPIKAGDTFTFRWGEKNLVILSTLPSLPGTTIVEAKPMIYANVSEAFGEKKNGSPSTNTEAIGETIAALMQEAQTKLQERTAEVGCNAVLGVNTNVGADTSGDGSKLVIVTLTGTPCVIVRSSDNASDPKNPHGVATGDDALVKPELRHLVFF